MRLDSLTYNMYLKLECCLTVRTNFIVTGVNANANSAHYLGRRIGLQVLIDDQSIVGVVTIHFVQPGLFTASSLNGCSSGAS